MNDIVFIHGAYHGTWCWEENFLRIFKEKGYKTHCPELRISRKEEKKILYWKLTWRICFGLLKRWMEELY